MNPIHLFAAVHIFPRQMCSFHSILETVFSSFLESLMEENDVTRLLVLTVKWLFKWPARLKILSVWLTKKDWGEDKLLLSLVLQLCFSNSAAIDAFSVCSTTALEILRQNETVSDVIVLLWLSSRNFLFLRISLLYKKEVTATQLDSEKYHLLRRKPHSIFLKGPKLFKNMRLCHANKSYFHRVIQWDHNNFS